jgi:hypothetical protein
MSVTPTDLAFALSAYAGDGCRGNAGGCVSAARVGGHKNKANARAEIKQTRNEQRIGGRKSEFC